MEINITEVSLSFVVSRPPKTCVEQCMPYVASTLEETIERVLPEGQPIPWWIKEPQKDSMKFIYSSPLQDVECAYSSRGILSIQGIKYKHIDQFNEHINTILNLLDTESVSVPSTKYKAVAKIKIRAPWDQDLLADIITNNSDIAQVMAMCERTSTLGERRLFSIVVDKLCRVAITHRNGSVLAMMSKLPDEEASVKAAGLLERLFSMYDEGVVTPILPPVSTAISGIAALRKKLPELFVNNYTRECPILPIMIPTFEEAERLQQSVIEYKGKYFTAPSGYFVGLKRNRLSNKDEFPCLVTCYLQNHLLRKGSETYKYYSTLHAAAPQASSKKRPLPKSIQDPSYHRKRASSFAHAVESATGGSVPFNKWLPQVTRQELWDWADYDIMTAVRSPSAVGSLVYRYFEEVIGVSIHVVVIKDGNFEPLVPRHRGRYVWAPPYPSHVVIFETYRTTYGNESCSYDFLTKGTATMFDENDAVVSYLISQKSMDSVPPTSVSDVREQTIDRNGKCATVTMNDGSHQCVHTRPLAVPVTPEPVCFFDSHIRKMNDAKQEMGLKTVDLSKRSTNDILYFPNEESFVYYVRRSEDSGTSEFLSVDRMDSRPSEEL